MTEQLILAQSMLFALISMMQERAMTVLSILFFLILSTIPLGYSLLKTQIFFQKKISLAEQITLSFGIGIMTLIALLNFSTFINFNIKTIVAVQAVLIVGAYLFKKQVPTVTNIKNCTDSIPKKIILPAFLLIIIYYSITPLTTDYAHFRDYPLLALGFEEFSKSILPTYGVEMYYPPGISLITGYIHLLIPDINPVAIMITLAHTFAVLIILLLYFLGKIAFQSSILGFFFASAFTMGAVSRNFVTGGATIPALLATICGLMFILFFLEHIKSCSNKNKIISTPLIFASIALGSTALAHFDTLLTFLWGLISISFCWVLMKARAKQAIIAIFTIGAISFVIAAPFLLRSYEYKKTLDKYWTDDVWDLYTKDEIHPKPLIEIAFVVGPLLFFLGISGYLLFLATKLHAYFKHKKQEMDILTIFFLAGFIWLILILISNSFFFLRLVRPIFLFYAINIILWHGITIPLTFGAGLLFYTICKWLKRKQTAIVFIVISLALFSVLDYESFNLQNVFTRQGGFLLLPFADRAGYVNQGDIEIFNTLNKLPRGLVLGYPSLAGNEGLPVFTHQKTYTHFTNQFYHNIQQHEWMGERNKASLKFFINDTPSFLNDKNISYIFIPAEITSSEQYSTKLLEKYELIARNGGAKLLSTKKTKKPIIHIEAEKYAQKNKIEIKNYFYGAMILSLRAVELKKNTSFEIPINIPKEMQRKKAIIFIKHLTFINPLSFDVLINGKKYPINDVTKKLMWTESSIEVPLSEINGQTIRFLGTSDGVSIFGFRKYLPEIDWIELTHTD